MENLGSIGGQPCVYSGDLRELRGICGVEGSDLLVHFAKKSLPPDVLLQKKIRVHHNCLRIVLALQRRQRIQEERTNPCDGWLGVHVPLKITET